MPTNRYNRQAPGGRILNEVLYGSRLHPVVQPLTLLYSIFDRNGTPFVYLLQSKWCLFHIPYQVMMMMMMMIMMMMT